MINFSWGKFLWLRADFKGQFEITFNFSSSEAMKSGSGGSILIQDVLVSKHKIFQLYFTLQSSLTCSYRMVPRIASISLRRYLFLVDVLRME